MKSTWKIRVALALNFFVFAILLNTVGIVIARVIEDYAVAGTTAATLEAFKDLSIAAASFLLASYVPRFGYRRTMLLGLMAVMLASILVAAVTGFWVTPVLYATIGISFALMKTAVYSTIGLITATQAEHTGLMNNLEGVFQVGAMSGPLIFAFMIDFSRWTDTYWILATLILIALALMWFTRLDEHEIEEHSEEAGFLEMLKLLKRPIVWTFVVCAWLYVMIEQSFGTWLPRFHEEIFGLSAAVASGFMSLYFGSIALSRFLAGYLSKRVPWIALQLTYLALAFVVTSTVVLLTSGNDPQTVTSWLAHVVARSAQAGLPVRHRRFLPRPHLSDDLVDRAHEDAEDAASGDDGTHHHLLGPRGNDGLAHHRPAHRRPEHARRLLLSAHPDRVAGADAAPVQAPRRPNE
jgi:fucose permease